MYEPINECSTEKNYFKIAFKGSVTNQSHSIDKSLKISELIGGFERKLTENLSKNPDEKRTWKI